MKLAALTTGDRFSTAGGAIYKYATSQPENTLQVQRQFLVKRLREALTKLIFATGIPKSLESMISLAKEVDELDNDYSSPR